MKKSKILIFIGLILIFISIGFLVYYYSGEPKIIEYTFSQNDLKFTQAEEKDWQLSIPAISVSAPIIINVNGNNEEEYLSSLQHGVAHLAGTGLPGNIGNIFIFGHSSYYFYDRGDYKNIFENLDKLNANDDIIINSNLGEYAYRVISKKIVNPDEVNVTGTAIENKETLSLMTCTPAGTSDQRLIILAERK